ncbi:MAG: SMP-30/gluconolactonase/LRE family protein [Anaerolineaceae bacterium]
MSEIGKIEVFSPSRNILGESPRWHPIEKCLYWTDIDTKLIYRQIHGEENPESFPMDVQVGCIGFRRSGGLILATSGGFQAWQENENPLIALGDPEAGKSGARFNDGLVDAFGRFWAGSMTENNVSSCLYRLDPDHSIHTMIKGVAISNGIGWNKENTRFYFTDTLKRTIWLYDFDLETGRISNRRVFIKTNGPGVPDGLTIDKDGNVWSVQCGVGKLIVYKPDGEIVREINFPTRCITACTFGGPYLSDLYVTSSSALLNSAELPDQPLAGAVFKTTTHSQGISSWLYAG